jgi:hypothetical protein
VDECSLLHESREDYGAKRSEYGIQTGNGNAERYRRPSRAGGPVRGDKGGDELVGFASEHGLDDLATPPGAILHGHSSVTGRREFACVPHSRSLFTALRSVVLRGFVQRAALVYFGSVFVLFRRPFWTPKYAPRRGTPRGWLVRPWRIRLSSRT